MALGFIVSGAMFTEIIFAYPGQGYLLLQAVQLSLKNLGSSYIDAYLIGWPRCYPHFPPEVMDCSKVREPGGTWQQSYKALEKLVSEGQVLAIGVSNFDLRLKEKRTLFVFQVAMFLTVQHCLCKVNSTFGSCELQIRFVKSPRICFSIQA